MSYAAVTKDAAQRRIRTFYEGVQNKAEGGLNMDSGIRDKVAIIGMG
ncbi:MAG: hypothetical protein QG555_1238, partial [Thermodesulfobacteriota bacterium]|nr:hypothetical protein [Thermodesulfobacteriota bacterium]